MNSLLITVCATSMSAPPVAAGISPESFVCSLQRAIAAEAVAADTHEGEIRTIAEDKSDFVLRVADDRLVTVRINENTVFTLDTRASDRDTALKIGRRAKVTLEDGVATRVEVSTKQTSKAR